MELKIKILDSVSISVRDFDVTVKGPKGELQRRMTYPGLKFLVQDNEFIIKSKEEKISRRDKMFINTFRAHVNNMMIGATEGFEYRMKICSGHFPMSVLIEKGFLVIKNFLGEKVPRKTKLIEGVEIKIDGDQILLKGVDKEKVGQMAAKIEQAAVVKNRDKRIFQDGCYITEKAGKSVA